jgi:hypothetical protein
VPAAAAPPGVQPGACSGVVSFAAPGAPPSLDLHLHPLPGDAGGAMAVSVVLTAPERELSQLRPPAGLRQPLEVRMSLQRAGCDPATGQPPLERRVLRAEPGTLLSLGTVTASGDRVRLQLDYQLEMAGNLLNERRFLAEGRQLFFLPAGS